MTVPLSMDWSQLAGVGLPIVLPLIGGIGWCFRTPQHVADLEDRSRRARSRLEGEILIPELVAISIDRLEELHRGFLDRLLESPGALRRDLERELSKTDYLPRLEGLARSYADLSELDAGSARVRRLGRRAIAPLAVAVASWSYFTVEKSLSNDPLPELLSVIAAATFGLSLVIGAALIIGLERAKNTWSNLCGTYA